MLDESGCAAAGYWRESAAAVEDGSPMVQQIGIECKKRELRFNLIVNDGHLQRLEDKSV